MNKQEIKELIELAEEAQSKLGELCEALMEADIDTFLIDQQDEISSKLAHLNALLLEDEQTDEDW